MIDFTENQRKTIASGLTLLALMVVFAFVAGVVWAVLKVLAFAAPAITPVVLGLFLALFFKPYYGGWKKLVKNPTLAIVLAVFSVVIPVSILLWYYGSFALEQASNLISQAPALAAKLTDWFHTTFPTAREFADKLGIP